jgi:hypothetical protein
MRQQFEDIILEGESKQVFLSTRITQKENKMLDDIRIWLQTQRNLSTVSKQETIMYTIRLGYEFMQLKIAEMDGKLENFSPSKIPQEVDDFSVKVMIQKRREINVDQYKEISNKETGGYKYGG